MILLCFIASPPAEDAPAAASPQESEVASLSTKHCSPAEAAGGCTVAPPPPTTELATGCRASYSC